MGIQTGERKVSGELGSEADLGFVPLLGPWEDRHHRRRDQNAPDTAKVERRAEAPVTEGSGFRFAAAPPHRVRDALVAAGARPASGSEGAGPPSEVLVDLAAEHWGRLGGLCGGGAEQLRVDLIATPSCKALVIDQALRHACPEAHRVAHVSTWASWTARDPLEERPGARFGDLDLGPAAVVMWSWS